MYIAELHLVNDRIQLQACQFHRRVALLDELCQFIVIQDTITVSIKRDEDGRHLGIVRYRLSLQHDSKIRDKRDQQKTAL